MTENQQQCLNKELDSALEEIFDYIDQLWIIKDMTKHIHKKFVIASPFLNLRDAFFHYNKMYDAVKDGDNICCIQQRACIHEHLNRGTKDFAIFLCSNFLIPILHEMIDTKTQSVYRIRHRLRHIYHEVKNIVVVIRLEGQALHHFVDQRISWLPDLVNVIEDFYSILDEKRGVKQFYVKFVNRMFDESYSN